MKILAREYHLGITCVKPLFPTHVCLNKLREKDYFLIFNKYFLIIDVKFKYEGKKNFLLKKF